ncbi:MAG: glycosyltransferase family 4 protein [Solirubrobacteraceae bacterium]|nr:glycosyltransferase family 4 protein [Solirubrobacteraceae bacterium]
MRICIAYDCLFPWTVGGAERWYRNLAERLAQDGHEVTYITRRQWPADAPPRLPGVRVVAISRDEPLYGPDGNRTIGEPLRYGWGTLGHLLRHGREYDVVHMASFPYFSVLAAAAARRLGRYELVVDWHELWSAGYWSDYLGGARGRAGRAVQRACARVRHRAFCFSRMHRDRLVAEGFRGQVTVLEGEYAGSLEPPEPNEAQPVAVFAGRHIAEKRAAALVPAVMRARATIPDLRAVIFGDGPKRGEVLAAIEDHAAAGIVEAPGFVDAGQLDATLREALCMVLPSSREGYGMVVVEASARGTPSVVVAGADNAAVELVQEGANGTVAASAAPEELAAAIERVHRAGAPMRASTCAWFAENAVRLSLEHSLQQVLASYYRGRR